MITAIIILSIGAAALFVTVGLRIRDQGAALLCFAAALIFAALGWWAYTATMAVFPT